MKNFQIFLTGGRVRYAAADRVEMHSRQVILYSENRIIATYSRPSVVMMSEYNVKGASGGWHGVRDRNPTRRGSFPRAALPHLGMAPVR